MKPKNIILTVLAFAMLLLGGLGFMCWSFVGKLEGSNSFILGICLGLGESAMEAKQYELAEQAFSKAMKIAEKGDDNKSDLAEVSTRLGQCARRLHKPALAAQYFSKAAELYEEADSDFMFSVERRIWLKCLNEYSAVLKETGKDKEAAKLSGKIAALSQKLGPVETFRQSTTEL